MLALLLGTITSVSIIILFVTIAPEVLTTPLWYVTVSTVWALNGWCWVIAILGFGRRLLSFNVLRFLFGMTSKKR